MTTETQDRPPPVGTEEVVTRVRRPIGGEAHMIDDEPDVLGELLEGLDGDGDYRLYLSRRPIGKAGKYAYVDALSPDDFSLDNIREQYGGGDYRVQGRKGNRYIPGKSAGFRIEGPSKPLTGDDDPTTAQQANTLAAGAVTIADLVAILADARRPHPETAHGNPTDMAVNLLTAMQTATAPLLAAILEQRSQSPDLEGLLALAERLAEIKGTAGGDGGYGSVVSGFLPVINRLAGLGAASAPAPNPPGASPGRLPPPPGEGPVALPPAPVPGWVTAFAPYLESLRPMAEGDAPAMLYAAVALDQSTDDVVLFMTEQFERGDAFRAEFYQYFPWAVPHRVWWDEFLGHLEDELLGDDEPDSLYVADALEVTADDREDG